MKAVHLIGYLFITVLLGACATQASKATRATDDGPNLASQYIYITERAAQQRMVTVHWINPPKSDDLKKKNDDGND